MKWPPRLLLAGIESGRRSDLAGERGVHESACECDWTPGQDGPQSVVIPSSLPLSLHSSHNCRENDGLYDGEVDDDDVYVEGERTERRVGFIEKRWVSLKRRWFVAEKRCRNVISKRRVCGNVFSV